MTTSELLNHLAERGFARPRPTRPGTVRALAVGSIEIAEAAGTGDRFLRAKWKERVGGTAAPYLLIADHAQLSGRVRVLGPTLANRPVLFCQH